MQQTKLSKLQNVCDEHAQAHNPTEQQPYSKIEDCGTTLVVADGGIRLGKDPTTGDHLENFQEIFSLRLILSEVLIMMKTLTAGGHFVCRLSDTFTDNTCGLLFAIARIFEECWIIKPYKSLIVNSERYVVGLRLKSRTTEEFIFFKNRFEEIHAQWEAVDGLASPNPQHFPSVILPPELLVADTTFLSSLKRSTTYLCNKQKEALRKVIRLAVWFKENPEEANNWKMNRRLSRLASKSNSSQPRLFYLPTRKINNNNNDEGRRGYNNNTQNSNDYSSNGYNNTPPNHQHRYSNRAHDYSPRFNRYHANRPYESWHRNDNGPWNNRDRYDRDNYYSYKGQFQGNFSRSNSGHTLYQKDDNPRQSNSSRYDDHQKRGDYSNSKYGHEEFRGHRNKQRYDCPHYVTPRDHEGRHYNNHNRYGHSYDIPSNSDTIMSQLNEKNLQTLKDLLRSFEGASSKMDSSEQISASDIKRLTKALENISGRKEESGRTPRGTNYSGQSPRQQHRGPIVPPLRLSSDRQGGRKFPPAEPERYQDNRNMDSGAPHEDSLAALQQLQAANMLSSLAMAAAMPSVQPLLQQFAPNLNANWPFNLPPNSKVPHGRVGHEVSQIDASVEHP